MNKVEACGVAWIDRFGRIVAELRDHYDIDKQNAESPADPASAALVMGGARRGSDDQQSQSH